MALYLDPITHPDAYNTVVFAGSLRTPGRCKVTGFSRDNNYDIKEGKGTAGATETLKGQPPAKGEIEFFAWDPEHFAAWTPILSALAFHPSKGASTATPTTAATPGSDITGTSGESSGSVSTGTIPAPGNTSGKSDGGASANNADGFPKDTSAKTTDAPALNANDAIDIFYPTLADIGVAHVLPPEKLGAWEFTGDGTGEMSRKISFVEFTQPPAASIAATPSGSTDQPAPGSTVAAGGSEGPATDTAANNAGGAAKDAQGAHGAP